MIKKQVLIFGASSGLGKELSKVFLKEGYQVIGLASTKKKSKKILAEINSKFFTCNYGDLKKKSDLQKIKKIIKKNKKLDLIIFSSSVLTVSKFSNNPDNNFENDLNINALSFIYIFKYFMKLKKNNNINLIVILSNLAIMGIKHLSSYSISKAILQSFTESIRGELTNSNVMAVYPGAMETNFDKNAKIQDKSLNYKLKRKKQSPKIVAKKIYSSYLKNKKFVYISFSTKIILFLKSLSANLLIKLINIIYK